MNDVLSELERFLTKLALLINHFDMSCSIVICFFSFFNHITTLLTFIVEFGALKLMHSELYDFYWFVAGTAKI